MPLNAQNLQLRFSSNKTAGVTHKPNSVSDPGFPRPDNDHSSWMAVTRHLMRPTRELERATLQRSSIWSCTGWGLPSFPGHPRNWCALTAPFHPYPTPKQLFWHRAVYFLLHFPSRRHDSTLWSTLPYGVRTFLWTKIVIQRSFELLRPSVMIIPINNSLTVRAIYQTVKTMQLIVQLGRYIHITPLTNSVFRRYNSNPVCLI